MSDDPAVKTKQLRHQAEEYAVHKDDTGFALFWEPGLGKSKELLDVAAHLFLQGKIKGMLVVAPNAVYRNWITQEIPKHLAVPYAAMAFNTKKSLKEEGQLKHALFLDPDEHADRFKILCISYDNVRLERGFLLAYQFLTIYTGMMVADESSAIADHDTLQTKNVKKLGQLARYRWIADGTPVADGPFLIHSQIEFIWPEFWKNCGVKSYGAFKNQFGEFELDYGKGGKQFKKRVAYRRLDYLQKLIKTVSSRLLKEDSGVELPPKMYTIHTFELTDEQRRVYDSVRDDFQAELASGAYLEAPLAIVRLARLMQITSGFVTAEDEVIEHPVEVGAGPPGPPTLKWNPHGEQLTLPYTAENIAQGIAEFVDDAEVKPVKIEKSVVDIMPPKDNPRLQLLLYLIGQRRRKIIVWCRFRREVEMICEALGDQCVRYDGSTKQKHRQDILDRFRDPNDRARILVANINAISQGVTLTIAKTMIYYSNSFSLRMRLQSEDRFHRIGQEDPVEIIDLAAEDTVDPYIIQSLRDKYDIAAKVTGDKLREWINEIVSSKT